MGILETIGQIRNIANGVATVLGRLNGVRTVVLEVQNRTSNPLRVTSHHHSHGGFAEPPNPEIPPGMVDIFGSQNKGGSLFTGTEGRVIYESSDEISLRVSWDNPFIGSNECSSRVEGGKTIAFRSTAICGSGNEGAHMKYEIREVLDPELVRSPDYYFVRQEGYIFSKEQPGTVPLHSWYDPVRNDNWATTNKQYTEGPSATIAPNYTYSRLEGYVFDPNKPQPPGTVPLHSWFSLERGDNWTTTNEQYTMPLVTFIAPDYNLYRREGYVYSPLEDQPPETVPLQSWYNGLRGDNFITTVWRVNL
jgi:hypothetical protein